MDRWVKWQCNAVAWKQKTKENGQEQEQKLGSKKCEILKEKWRFLRKERWGMNKKCMLKAGIGDKK